MDNGKFKKISILFREVAPGLLGAMAVATVLVYASSAVVGIHNGIEEKYQLKQINYDMSFRPEFSPSVSFSPLQSKP